MRLKHWITKIGSTAGSALMVGLMMGAPNDQRCGCLIECRCRTTMTDNEPFVDDRPQFNQKESHQTGLRDGFIRFEGETRLDEVETDDG